MKKTLIAFLIFFSQNLSYSQWFEAPTPTPAFNLFSFSFPSATTGFAVGYGNRMIKSTNGGINWFNISFFNTTANDLNAVCFINENTGWMGSTSDTLFYTTNSGSNWSPQLNFPSDVNKIFFINSTTGWVLSQPKLYRTTNAGQNWSMVNSSMQNYFMFVTPEIGWKTIYSGGSSTLHKTTDGGFTWAPYYSTSNFRAIYSIEFADENTGWAAGYREHILKTTDGGVTWKTQRDMGNSVGVYSMDFIDANTGWAVCDPGPSLYTVDGGASWNQVAVYSGRANVKFINSTTGWMIGSKVYRTTTGGFTPRNLQNTALIEGLYNENSNTMTSDNATVYLRNNSAPYSIIDSANAVLNSNGTGSYNFFNAVNGVNYYLVVKHRNSIETWSSSPKSFASNNLTYDFTASSSQAFGDNLKIRGTRWTVYSGDVNKDGLIDLNDVVFTFNDASAFATGYLMSDVNGDNVTDLSDLGIVYNNANDFIKTVRP